MTAEQLLHTLPDRGIDLGLGSTMHTRYRVTEGEFHAMIGAFKARKDLTLLQEHQIDRNETVTFLSREQSICLIYAARSEVLRVICDKRDLFTPLPLQPQATARVTEPMLGLSPLDYTHREITDGNGMSYTVILPDGRYLVFDGGYRTDAPALYSFLQENTRHPDGRVVIAVWIFTHAHADHYGAFRAFAAEYADKVTLQAAVFNPILPEMLPRGKGYNPYFAEELQNDLVLFGAVKYYRPHTGQVLYFGETPLEILYTYEQHLPGTMPYMNDSSTVTRLTLNGQTLLFLADCERVSSDLLCDLYDEGLKSDVMQVNHHGYSGGTVELYQKVAPSFSLWPTNKITFDLRVIGQKYPFIGNALESNKYLFDTLGRTHCLISDEAALYPLPLI